MPTGISNLNHNALHFDNFQFANFPFERGEILFSMGFFDFSDIRKLQWIH